MEILAIESIKKAYGAGQFQLDNINMRVQQGDFVALLGPEGAGKTPLLQIITGRNKADSGKVSFDGQNIRKLRADTWRYITWIPDDILYYEIRTIRRIFERTISWTGLGTLRHAQQLCQMFSVDMNQEVLDISREQNRCVSFINAVFTNPRLICIDELYHGLSEETYLKMLNVLAELCRRGATVIASFDEYEKISGYCNRYMILNKGHCVAEGAIEADYVPPKMVSMDLKSCFKETVSEAEKEEYIGLFVDECCRLAGENVATRENRLFFPYKGDLTALSHLLYKYGCEDYLVEQMTMEEDYLRNYERWQG